MKKISVFNLKGGIGKTTTCLILSNLLAQDKKVLLIDMDAANSLTSFFVEDADDILNKTVLEGLLGTEDPNNLIIKVKENFSFLPADTSLSEQATQAGDLATLNLAKMLKKIKGFDYVILDCPPHKLLETRQALSVSNFIITPTTLDKWSTRSLDMVEKFLKEIESVRENTFEELENHFILPTMFDRKQILQKMFLDGLKEEYKDKLLPPISRRADVLKFVAMGDISMSEKLEAFEEHRPILEAIKIGVMV